MPLNISIIGCGWLGSSLALKLRDLGMNVSGTTRSVDRQIELTNEGIDTFIYDYRINKELPHELKKSDLIIYTIPPDKINKREFLNSINLLSELADDNRRLIYLSSIGIYPQEGSWDEDSKFHSKSILNEAEKTFLQDGGNKFILRLGGLIGGKRHPINQLKSKDVDKNGLDLTYLIHRKDIERFIVKLISIETPERIFNLIYPMEISKAEYYSLIARLHDLSPPRFLKMTPVKRHITSKNASNLNGFYFQNDPRLFKFES
jgi:nucleoside-diphosphate-sugar epimerase